MPYSFAKLCSICGSLQKDISAHLRTRHKLPSWERQRYLQQVKEQPRNQSMQGHIEKDGIMGNDDKGRSDGFREQQNSTN